ncbi:MgtC/SapB family protein [Halomonas sp. IOP_31]|uniref:MgtC/SapB family protein n=1 Tax=Halomonas sp. IOP_31 TaxID=2876584 RepID=UPI003FA5D838|nr:MgtC/SapB family protein [Halomonas sp. IOP_31]
MKPSTTAASVLFTAGLGIVAGLGMHVLAVALAVIVVLILYVIGLIEDRLSRSTERPAPRSTASSPPRCRWATIASIINTPGCSRPTGSG